jgi:hypothetical protein
MNDTNNQGPSFSDALHDQGRVALTTVLLVIAFLIGVLLLISSRYSHSRPKQIESRYKEIPIAAEDHPLRDANVRDFAINDACWSWVGGTHQFVPNESNVTIGDRTFYFRYMFDPETGFGKGIARWKFPWDTRYIVYTDERSAKIYMNTYTEQMARLIESHGVPASSKKPHMMPPDVMITLLDSDKLVRVDKFPFQICRTVSLLEHTTREGTAVVLMEDKKHNRYENLVGYPGERIYVGRLPEYPKTFVIRVDNNQVDSYFEDGMRMCSVYDDQEWHDKRNARSPHL